MEAEGVMATELTARSNRCEAVARAFHETYETLAPHFGYDTREESAVPWADVPEQNKRLMRATVDSLIEQGVIR